MDFSQIQAVGGGVVHTNKPRCAELARAKLLASVTSKEVKIDPTAVELQSKKKEAQLYRSQYCIGREEGLSRNLFEVRSRRLSRAAVSEKPSGSIFLSRNACASRWPFVTTL